MLPRSPKRTARAVQETRPLNLFDRIALRLREAVLPHSLRASARAETHPPAFKAAALQSSYERDGYVIVPVDDSALLEQARKAHQALPAIESGRFHSSLQIPNPEYRRASSAALAPLAAHMIGRWLNNYELLSASFVCKTPGVSSNVVPHQDWTFIDESRGPTLNIWCPLVDVDKRNGALHILKGSHNLGHTIRGTLTPFAFQKVIGSLTFDRLEYLPMKAGEALIYDVRLVHSSPPNTSPEIRVAAGLGAIPAGVQRVHYFQSPVSGRLEKYELGDEFWMQYVFGQNQMPPGARLLGYDDDYKCPQFTLEDIEPLLTRTQVASVEERKTRDLTSRM